MNWDGIESDGNEFRVVISGIVVMSRIEDFIDAFLVKEMHSKNKQLAQDADPPILDLNLDRFYNCLHCGRTFKTANTFPFQHVCCDKKIVQVTKSYCFENCTQHSPEVGCIQFKGFSAESGRRKIKPEGVQTGKEIFIHNGIFELWFQERYLGSYKRFDSALSIHKQLTEKHNSFLYKLPQRKHAKRLCRGLNLPKVSPPPPKKHTGNIDPAFLRGVFRTRNGWEAKVRLRQEHHSLGEFQEPVEAALAWDRAVLQNKGPEWTTNFPAGTTLEDVFSGRVKPLCQKMQKPLRELNQSISTFVQYYRNGHLRGVEKQRNSYISKIRLNGIMQHLGISNNPVSAALKYDRARLHIYGPTTWTNFPAETQLIHVTGGKVKPRLLIAHEQRLAARIARESQMKIEPNQAHPWANLRYRGVHKTENGKYRTRIYHNKTKISCGTYTSVFQAALAWDRKKLELKGDDIWTNFPEGTTEEDILACRVPPNDRLIQEAHQEANPEQAKPKIEYDEMEDEVFEYLEEQQALGVKVSGEKVKRVFHIGWSRSKALIERFYRNNSFETGSSNDEGTFLHRKSDWNRVVGVGSYYQAKVEEWSDNPSYNTLARKHIMGSVIPPREFEYQLNNSIDGRHFSLSRYFIYIHGPQFIVSGELLPGQPTVMFKTEGSSNKQSRSLKTKFRHCQVTHEGPCIYAIPNEVQTSLGIAKLKSFRMGDKFEVSLPFGHAFLSREFMEPFLVEHCKKNWSSPYIPDQNAKRSLNGMEDSESEGECGNYIFCVDCDCVVEATFGRVNNCQHQCKAFGGKKVSRGFGKRYHKCTHIGPCVYELPPKILTPYGIAKISNVYDDGRKMKLVLPYAKMYSYEKQFVPWILQSIRDPKLVESEEEMIQEEVVRGSNHKYGLRKRRQPRPDRKVIYGIPSSSDSSPISPKNERFKPHQSRRAQKRKRLNSASNNADGVPRKKRKQQQNNSQNKTELRSFWKFCPHPKCRWATQHSGPGSEVLIKHHYARHEAADARYFCSICNLGFFHSLMRDKHQEEKHKKFRPQKCPVCETLFTEWDKFKQHNIDAKCSPPPSPTPSVGTVKPVGSFWLALDGNNAAIGLFTSEEIATKAMNESAGLKCNMCGHTARTVLKNSKFITPELQAEIEQMADVYFKIASNPKKGLIRIDGLWTFYEQNNISEISISMPSDQSTKVVAISEEDSHLWDAVKQNAVTRVKAEKLGDLIMDLRRLNTELGSYPSVSQIKEGKCWKLFQHHAKIVRHFGGRDIIRKFVGAGITIPESQGLNGDDKDYIPPIPPPLDLADHVLYNPIVTTPVSPASKKRQLEEPNYSPTMDAGFVCSPPPHQLKKRKVNPGNNGRTAE